MFVILIGLNIVLNNAPKKISSKNENEIFKVISKVILAVKYIF